MNNIQSHELEEKEKKEIRKMVEEATALYEFIQENGLTKRWMGDSEQFMGYTFIHTKNLVRHSITLTKLTHWLIGLTIGLAILSLVHIIILILSF